MSGGIIGAWTDPNRVEELRRLVADGLPFSEIGKRMGLTKNQVIAKAMRMGLARPADAPMTPGQIAAKRALETKRENEDQPPPAPRTWSFPPGGRCVFPHGHPTDPDFHYCGAKVAEYGLPYCAEHMQRAYQRPVTRSAE